MRVLLLLPADGKSVTVHLGLGQLSAALRAAGHETALLKVNRAVSRRRFLAQALGWEPELFAASCVTHHWPRVTEWAGWLKAARPGVPFTVGGPHVTVTPEAALECPHVDAAIAGEGERSLPRLVAAYAAGENQRGIPGTAVRGESGCEFTPPEQFCQNLDELPLADRSIFTPSRDFPVMAGRGCPFDCSYCCNHILKKAQGGRYVRMRSPERVIEEIRLGRTQGEIRRVVFEDDTFTLMREWLAEFLPLYREEIGLPFVANARVGNFDRETARLLKQAGCDYVLIGVESGCESLRRDILNRRMTNAEIIETFDMARSEGLATYAYYMVGFPGETAAMARETMELHRRLRPEAGFQISVFYPYPNTRLWEIARDRGLLQAGEDKATFEGGWSTLELKDMTRSELGAIYAEFERMRLESSFADRYISSNYPWARLPVALAGVALGRARALRWAKRVRDRMLPTLEFRVSALPAGRGGD